MTIVDGKAISRKILDETRIGLQGHSISIVAVWAGGNLAIGRFVKMKKKAAESVGIKMLDFNFDTMEKMSAKLKELAEDKNINGIIVELPLPRNFNRDEILSLIPEEKDIDILSLSAQNKFYSGTSPILPPAVEALKILFEKYEIVPKGKIAAVFGQSILIGKPVSHWLEEMGAKVFRIDEFTLNPEELSRQADIIISGVGKPNLIKEDMVKNDAVIVDFGFEKLGNRVAGDVDFNLVASKSSLITPVPGGMGPIVIATFLKNAVEISQNHLLKS